MSGQHAPPAGRCHERGGGYGVEILRGSAWRRTASLPCSWSFRFKLSGLWRRRRPLNDPTDIDPKVALETGYAILLGKPIVLVVSPGTTANVGLRRIATKVIELQQPLGTEAGAQQLTAELAGFDPERSS
jgi:hypothetical protein